MSPFKTVLALLSLTAALACGSALSNTGKVLSGAQTVLDGLCETISSKNLEMAKDRLDAGDLVGAASYLRAELAEGGHQKDVAALLALIESQIPPDLLPLPGLIRG